MTDIKVADLIDSGSLKAKTDASAEAVKEEGLF